MRDKAPLSGAEKINHKASSAGETICQIPDNK